MRTMLALVIGFVFAVFTAACPPVSQAPDIPTCPARPRCFDPDSGVLFVYPKPGQLPGVHEIDPETSTPVMPKGLDFHGPIVTNHVQPPPDAPLPK